MVAIRVFSKRYEQAIFERKLKLSISRRLRRRIWSLLNRYNYSYLYRPDPSDNWQLRTTVLDQLPGELCYRYGEEQLLAFRENEDTRVPVDLKGFVEGGYPSQVFDVVELFIANLPSDQQQEFQRELNTILEDERLDWRVVDGQFFKIDSEFLDLHVVARSYELLKAEGFEGALNELNQARNELAAGNVKEAIHNACKGLESVLKSVLNTDSGSASSLIKRLVEYGFYEGIPEDAAKAFGDQVLMALPFLRNRLAGHGQGTKVIDVPEVYGELAVHLAAAFILFIVQRSIQLKDKSGEIASEDSNVDVPF